MGLTCTTRSLEKRNYIMILWSQGKRKKRVLIPQTLKKIGETWEFHGIVSPVSLKKSQESHPIMRCDDTSSSLSSPSAWMTAAAACMEFRNYEMMPLFMYVFCITIWSITSHTAAFNKWGFMLDVALVYLRVKWGCWFLWKATALCSWGLAAQVIKSIAPFSPHRTPQTATATAGWIHDQGHGDTRMITGKHATCGTVNIF